jgi:hypothetical protein
MCAMLLLLTLLAGGSLMLASLNNKPVLRW